MSTIRDRREPGSTNNQVHLPLADIERALIDQFLRSQGYDDAHSMAVLTDDERVELLKAASVFASTRLSEIESRAHLLEELHQRTS
jgi:hypothetical protein